MSPLSASSFSSPSSTLGLLHAQHTPVVSATCHGNKKKIPKMIEFYINIWWQFLFSFCFLSRTSPWFLFFPWLLEITLLLWKSLSPHIYVSLATLFPQHCQTPPWCPSVCLHPSPFRWCSAQALVGQSISAAPLLPPVLRLWIYPQEQALCFSSTISSHEHRGRRAISGLV